ncbi:hypothetical protein CLOM_g18332 [Closterium sp. NIES-68]|nr:hypothetical protein CLOM_g18332 [Closterium sp. NIES-68]GJP65813.1 hypothetical protein CLOP_g22729 [Closterium sp. NIES-67]
MATPGGNSGWETNRSNQPPPPPSHAVTFEPTQNPDKSSQPPPPSHAAGPSRSATRGPGAALPPPVGASSRAAAQQFSRQFTSILAQASSRHAQAHAHAAGAQSRVIGVGGGAAGASRVFPPGGAGVTRQFQPGGGGVGSFAAGSFVGGSFAGGSLAAANPSRMYAARTRMLPPPAPGAAAAAAAAAAGAPPAGATRGLTPQQIAKIEDVFTVFDKDGSGSIDKMEMKFAMSQLGINVSQEEFEEIFAAMDRNGDGAIDFEEYVAVMTGYMGEQNMHQDMIAMYQLFSDKRTGKISQRTLKRGVLDLGIVFSDDEIRGMFYSADTDGNGEIDIDEFSRIAELAGIC